MRKYSRQTPFANPDVLAAYDAFPATTRAALLRLRELIFATAAKTPGVGKLEESLRWGEPAYLTTDSKSGSTIRLATFKKRADQFAIYFNCQTNLVDSFRSAFGTELQFDGNRAIVFGTRDKMPIDVLQACISAALTYHHK